MSRRDGGRDGRDLRTTTAGARGPRITLVVDGEPMGAHEG